MEMRVSLQRFSAASTSVAVVAVRSSETAALLEERAEQAAAVTVVAETTTLRHLSPLQELQVPVVVVVVDHEMRPWLKSF
jgi:aminoglycoside phosphotransferase